MTETTPKKPWYRRRRFVCPALLLVLAYFCLVPSRLVISPETTLITEPLTPGGRPDYFAAYEKTWASKLSPPEDNGLRMMIAAIGPRMLEMHALANETAWEDIPKDEKFGGKKWFEQRWLPLCEHMYIDPYAKPKFYDSIGFFAFIQKKQKIGTEPNIRTFDHLDDSKKYHEELIEKPWKAEEHPEVAAWLKERGPVLDLFGVAVRKPNYVCWRPRNEGGCIAILLPDVQATRSYARDIQVRITARLGRGDVDGAWYDVMSLLHLSRCHYCTEIIYVTNMVGAAVDRMACQSASVILKQGNPSREQLDRFDRDLASLPSALSIDPRFEEMMMFDSLHMIAGGSNVFWFIEPNADFLDGFVLKTMSLLPVDLNIAGKRLTELYAASKSGESNESWGSNPVLWQRTTKKLNEINDQLKNDLQSLSTLPRLPLIRTRSKMLAEMILWRVAPYGNIDHIMSQAMAQYDLLRIAVALERFHKAESDYPDDLEKLVPNYLDEIPLDPFTGRKTITYKRNPEEGSPYMIYSYGRNGEDDGGKEAMKNPDASTMHLWEKHDIVLKR